MPPTELAYETSVPGKFTPTGGAQKKIILLKPRGFCAGVVRAIDVVRIALDLYGAPIYVRKEIVHNRHVVEELRTAGAIFVEELSEVPQGARVIFSAHGISPAVRDEAKERRLQVIDATCPLVTKVHQEAVRFAKQGYTIILIGHRDHDEVIGTLGEAPNSTVLVSDVDDVNRLNVKDPERMVYLTQTTLSLDETSDIVTRLLERFPKIIGPKTQDICYATENRQLAVKAVAPLCQALLVVGSQNSSNSRRLVEVCEKAGVPAYLLDDCSEVQAHMLKDVDTVAVTAGASAPEHLVEELINHLKANGYADMEEAEIKEEDVRFTLPSDLESFTPRLYTVRA
ncbi:MAG: 4-hydroxy-3-methylbut-2-enyl diphosphate reductase [Acidobacteriota bacterium]|nr:4-hydroxy-3-methylbut-2-enyl diphosphate reductase [Acidobacteriota bacterium]